MLLSYRVTNYKGFGKPQILDLTATSQNEFPDELYLINDSLKVNKKACIIGPNSSGKSQLLTSLYEFTSAVGRDDLKEISAPFLLDTEHASKETKYEIIMFSQEINEFLFYTLSVKSGKVIEENLFSKTNEKNQHNKLVFKRHGEEITFAPEYKREAELVSEISETTLLVKFAKGLKNKKIDTLITWFNSVIRITPKTIEAVGGDIVLAFINQSIENIDNPDKLKTYHNSIINDVLDYLKGFNIPVKNIKIDIDDENHAIVTIIPTSNSSKEIELTIAQAEDFFSTGSFNIIILMMILKIMSYNPGLILFDEIDGTFHHKLSQRLISIMNKMRKKENCQFILATHDILLLDCNFRRDSIYTITKDKDLCSIINRVSDYSIRKDAKLSLKYLSDEFGALPKILKEYS